VRIDLIQIGLVGPALGPWPHGAASRLDATPEALAGAWADLAAPAGAATDPSADAVLFWDPTLGEPDPGHLALLLGQPDDVWHAGLRLGLGGLPSTIDDVAPTWMLNRDPDPTREATSWRLTWRAALVRRRVLASLGPIDPSYASLDAAALDLGHRWITLGARLRHVPTLVPTAAARPPVLGLADELRFVERRYGRKWMGWTAATRVRHPLAVFRGVRRAIAQTGPPAPADLPALVTDGAAAGSVTVLIPTVERYPFLRVVLEQLRGQTVAPSQVIVIDQTPVADRDPDLYAGFADLPLELITLDQAGQCRARNAGLERATGDHVLFIDDDDDIPADLIEAHLRSIDGRRVEVSSGVVHEPNGPEQLSDEFRRFRVSDTFPTNNTMVRRDALAASGWFDLAYDRGDRADHDLGMRLYLSGARMVMDPTIDLLHHHAPRGGLRVHAARAITYGTARGSIRIRQPLSPTQLYLWRRYYSPDQVRKAIRLHLAGALFGSGSRSNQLARVLVQAASLPLARREVAGAERLAADLLAHNPRIGCARVDGSPP